MPDWLNRNQLLLALAVLAALVAGMLLSRLTDDSPSPIEFLPDAGLQPGTPIQVHVAGAVLSPGVIEALAGQRVADAIAAAGGAAASADLDSLNLARRLRDGERILVPSLRVPVTAQPASADNPLDINSASREELDGLPGIGVAYSRRIVDSRLVDGPFGSPEDLVERGVLPEATLDGIRDLIVVGP